MQVVITEPRPIAEEPSIHQLWAQRSPSAPGVGRLEICLQTAPDSARSLQPNLILQIVAAFMLFFCSALISAFANVLAKCTINAKDRRVQVLTLVSTRGRITTW